MALINKLSAIGDAIRSKTGKSEKLTLDSMVTEIKSITSGGGGGDTPTLEQFFNNELTEFRSDTITSIPHDYAFYNDKTIRVVELPNLEHVGKNFVSGTSIKEINFPNLLRISNSSFADNCYTLTSCSIPKAKSLEYNKGIDFSDCRSLTSLDISSMEVISAGGFNGCKVIPKIELPSVAKIYSYSFSGTFEGCYKLTALILRNPAVVVLDTGQNLFKSCPINNGGYNGLEGYIYVPKALIEDYKVATNWTLYAEKFRAIEDYPDICGEVS